MIKTYYSIALLRLKPSFPLKLLEILELQCNGQLQTRLLGIISYGACCYGSVA